MEEVSLIVENEVFRVRKEDLCEHSDYFRAMFSGNYIEKNEKEIRIDIVDANSMRLILRFIKNGLVCLNDVHPLDDLAISANFLQIGELMKQIQYILISRLSLTNWLSTIDLAEAISSKELKQSAVIFGILNFHEMKPEHIPTIQQLYWYLSHPYLEIESEYQVFKFGFDWIVNSKCLPDGLLIILGCLDIKALRKQHIDDIIKQIDVLFNDSFPFQIVQSLADILNEQPNGGITSSKIIENKSKICDKYSEETYMELLDLVRCSRERLLELVPCVPVILIDEKKVLSPGISSNYLEKPKDPQFMYQFREEKGFEKWLEVASNSLWGWSVAAWGRTKLVVVGGEYGKGSGHFMREVAIYDTLDKEWIRHGVSLPPRRHAGVAVMGNSLYIVGGVGTFRVVLCSSVVYNLEERSFIKIANLPDAMQNPAICAHKGHVYVGTQRNIYRYNDSGDSDYWELILNTNVRASSLISHENYIYVTQSYFHELYRFIPSEDSILYNVATFANTIAAVCSSGKKIVAFTQTIATNEFQSVEVFEEDKTRIVWSEHSEPWNEMKIYDTAGCCSLVLSIPHVTPSISQFVRKYLSKFPDS